MTTIVPAMINRLFRLTEKKTAGYREQRLKGVMVTTDIIIVILFYTCSLPDIRRRRMNDDN